MEENLYDSEAERIGRMTLERKRNFLSNNSVSIQSFTHSKFGDASSETRFQKECKGSNKGLEINIYSKQSTIVFKK